METIFDQRFRYTQELKKMGAAISVEGSAARITGRPLRGAQVEAADLRGSQCNDAFTVENGQISTLTNNAGGILGGITNGMPVIFRAAIKPTPSISRPQQSVSLSKAQEQELVVKGRHDPCIVPRAVPVIEAAAAIAIFDLILGNTQTDRRK